VVVREAIRWGFDADVAIDFLCTSPSAGDAINAAAARQLMKTKRLVFIIFAPFYLSISQGAAPQTLDFSCEMRPESPKMGEDRAHIRVIAPVWGATHLCVILSI
jgi:hypothetical protein